MDKQKQRQNQATAQHCPKQYITTPRHKLNKQETLKAKAHKSKLIHWQQIWDKKHTGRLIHNIVTKVTTKWTCLTWKTIQAITYHGNLKAYYDWFNLRDDVDVNCEYYGTIDNISHATIACNES